MSPEAVIAIAGIVIGVMGLLIGFAVKLILDRLDRMESDQATRFDTIDRQMERSRERLHKIENWIAGQIGLERLEKVLGRTTDSQ